MIDRYPATLDEFYLARLPGTFDENQAGKRMKLPTPETWETQVALRGNKAGTWQDLIGNSPSVVNLLSVFFLFTCLWCFLSLCFIFLMQIAVGCINVTDGFYCLAAMQHYN